MITLATLGPLGSDSENAATLLNKQLDINADIVLLDSFSLALQHAAKYDGLALIPAAYQEKDEQGRTSITWADTHFKIEVEGKLELWAAQVLPLKRFAIARRQDVTTLRTLALHAATHYYAENFLPNLARLYFSSKPAAVAACAQGNTDACIGSLDVVERHSNLVVERMFDAQMCWTIYRASAPSSMVSHL